MICEHDSVVLTRDIEEYDLKSGKVGVAVHCYPDGTAFEVEFMTADGNTTAVLTLTNGDIRPVSPTERKIQVLKFQMNELDRIVHTVRSDRNFDVAKERLSRWKTRTVKLISEQIGSSEGRKLEWKKKLSYSYIDLLSNIVDEAEMYGAFLQALREEIQEHPDELSSDPVGTNSASPLPDISGQVASKFVFIVHGHDDANMLRLEKLIRDQWKLEPLILKYEPGKGRTLIEKFEDEAGKARFAMVLITPDDLIETEKDVYTQARPNVVFELGWFYGRIGRESVCILSKSGTKLHSDLDGIHRVDFNESVDEAILGIEAELRSAGLI